MTNLNIKRKLLVVDDMEVNRMVLEDLFNDDFDVIEAENGKDALDLVYANLDELSIILLDLVMPVMDGFDVLRDLNENGIINTIPVIMITSENDDEKTLIGYKLGVSDLISKPINPDIVYRRVNNVVDLYDHKRNLEAKLNEQKIILEQQSKRLKQANQFVIDALGTTVEFRNLEAGTHIKRIRILTKILLEELKDDFNLTIEQIDAIASASVVHDIGKIVIPDAILLAPRRLTPEELEVMKTHTTSGCKILESLDYMEDQEYYRYCYDICRHHHERWDGNGYPDKLKGDEIPIWAQAVSLADVYEALTSERVYKPAFSHDKAITMILNGECGVFNPKLMEFLDRVKDTLHDQFLVKYSY